MTVMTLDWTAHNHLAPREQYDQAGAIIDDAKAAAAARRARIAHDLALKHGAQEAATVLGISDKRVYQLAARYRDSQPEICDDITGRAISSYDLLDEVEEAHGLDRREAHEAIHAMLADLIADDGEDQVVIARRPQDPGLLKSNPRDRDVRYWLVVRQEYVDMIREALASVYGGNA
ncbi:hypothetical protein [Streptomyces sp. Da 82-17]|uniref:hypothetical protein n=1 Tax=Streptomyces sp. Da 82-17 TaxID=3377116 RepID=UPI0038D439A0